MKKILTFGDTPDEPRAASIGIYQRLYELDKQKKAKKDPPGKEQAVDNPLLIDSETITEMQTVTDLRTLRNLQTVTEMRTDGTITEMQTVRKMQTDGDYVSIENNWMKFPNEIFLVMSKLSGVELKVYLAMVSRSYGSFTPKNLCTIGHQDLCLILGIDSVPAISRAVSNLIKKGFIKRQIGRAHV